jgi:integrase
MVWYVRVGKGPRTRIKAAYGTPEFDAAYRAAMGGEKPHITDKAAGGSLRWLVTLYRQSSAWRDLALSTRKHRDFTFLQILKVAGDEPISRIDRAAIIRGRDRRAATPHQARHFVTALRGLFKWAFDADLVKVDPTVGVAVKKPKSNGFPVWTDDENTRFERRWPRGTRERVMFDIFLYTGLRRGDATRLGRQHVRDGIITLDTEKTGVRVTLPVLPELQATLDAGPTGDLAFIATTSGNPMAKESVGTLFREACLAAGVRKSAHGLRKAAATNAANHGATVAQLEAIFGWEGGRMASLYTRSANRKFLAASAMSKLSRTETGTSIPAPSGKVRASDRNSE